MYSKWRGTNRFPGLVLTIDILAERPEVLRRHPRLPALTGLRDWIGRETRLANPVLEGGGRATGDPDLALALEWSEAVNRSIEEIVREVPPFPFVRESLASMAGKADVMVVSATPREALEREWDEHDLESHVALIAGQECGSKKEHLALTAVGRYEPAHILMVGDAPGDYQAAKANGVLFYPIDPGSRKNRGNGSSRRPCPDFSPETYAGRVHGCTDRAVRGVIAGAAAVEVNGENFVPEWGSLKFIATQAPIRPGRAGFVTPTSSSSPPTDTSPHWPNPIGWSASLICCRKTGSCPVSPSLIDNMTVMGRRNHQFTRLTAFSDRETMRGQVVSADCTS